jgi:hypothetical protein
MAKYDQAPEDMPSAESYGMEKGMKGRKLHKKRSNRHGKRGRRRGGR